MPDETNGAGLPDAEDTAAVLSHAAEGQKTYLPDPADTAAEGDPPGDDAAAAAEEKPEGEQPPKRASAQERIDELTRDKHAERRAREAAERRLAELEAHQAQPRAEAPKAEAEPSPDDFQYGETDPGFIRALARFEAKQAYRDEAQQHQRATQARTVEQAWNERQAAFAKDKADYFEAVNSDHLTISQPMADAIRDSEDGPAVAYHLAQRPDEARRIAALTPLAQIREIGRIEARVAIPAADPTPPTKTVSDAPPVAPTVRGASGKFKPPADTSDFAAFEAAYPITGR